MISKSRIKSIKQLELKKFRRQTGLFVAEGPKVVGDLLEVMPAETLIGTDEWWAAHTPATTAERIVLHQAERSRVRLLQHPLWKSVLRIGAHTLPAIYAWRSTMCKTPEMWAPSSA